MNDGFSPTAAFAALVLALITALIMGRRGSGRATHFESPGTAHEATALVGAEVGGEVSAWAKTNERDGDGVQFERHLRLRSRCGWATLVLIACRLGSTLREREVEHGRPPTGLSPHDRVPVAIDARVCLGLTRSACSLRACSQRFALERSWANKARSASRALGESAFVHAEKIA